MRRAKRAGSVLFSPSQDRQQSVPGPRLGVADKGGSNGPPSPVAGDSSTAFIESGWPVVDFSSAFSSGAAVV